MSVLHSGGSRIYPSKSGLERIPYEIMGFIIRNLEIEDIFDLSLVSKHFQYLVREDRFCRVILTEKAPYALETREAETTGYARALRRLIKRRCALSQADPFVIGNVGSANSYFYHGGVLCYIVEARPNRWLRILDLRNSADTELVVDIPKLVSEAILGTRRSTKFKFRILHHAEGITSCLFAFALPEIENWLLVFKAGEQLLFEPLQLCATQKIFVRNNSEFLYFGTYSDPDDQGGRRWALRGFEIKEQRWLDKKVRLSNVESHEIGSTVCFEVIGDYFYALSIPPDREAEEPEPRWVSYYQCSRFRLDEKDPEELQEMKKKHSWRRHHLEGPIDDRWGFLKLETDEVSGKIFIVESRKEWLSGKNGRQNTYYTTEVIFEDGDDSDDEDLLSEYSDDTLDDGQSEYPYQEEPPDIRTRSHSDVHPGVDPSTNPFYTRHRAHLQSYQRSSNTFFDLIDSSSTGEPDTQCLRLLAGSRRMKSPFHSTDIPPKPEDQLSLEEQIRMFYHPNTRFMWPPEPKPSGPDPQLEEIRNILNPPNCRGNITASGDERSVVYTTGEGPTGLKALVYISFDPSAQLHGMRCHGRLPPDTLQSGLQTDNDTLSFGDANHAREATSEAKGQEARYDIDRGNTSRQHGIGRSIEDKPLPIFPPRSDGRRSWVRFERPMYRDLPGRLSFALPKVVSDA
ncbi:hypothetical protein SLS62_003151 [Diatrype stigma]|uniref:F-box domain-containing protein n=1 Tax=Diatrype stigma TaxID=117547 RepID=A0AAN9UX65_9PEZI